MPTKVPGRGRKRWGELKVGRRRLGGAVVWVTGEVCRRRAGFVSKNNVTKSVRGEAFGGSQSI